MKLEWSNLQSSLICWGKVPSSRQLRMAYVQFRAASIKPTPNSTKRTVALTFPGFWFEYASMPNQERNLVLTVTPTSQQSCRVLLTSSKPYSGTFVRITENTSRRKTFRNTRESYLTRNNKEIWRAIWIWKMLSMWLRTESQSSCNEPFAKCMTF